MFTITVSAEELAVVSEALGRKVEAKAVRAPRKVAAARRPAIKWQSPGLPALRPMKVSEMDAAERAWNAECERARVLVASGHESDAGRELHALIALHYPASVTA